MVPHSYTVFVAVDFLFFASILAIITYDFAHFLFMIMFRSYYVSWHMLLSHALHAWMAFLRFYIFIFANRWIEYGLSINIPPNNCKFCVCHLSGSLRCEKNTVNCFFFLIFKFSPHFSNCFNMKKINVAKHIHTLANSKEAIAAAVAGERMLEFSQLVVLFLDMEKRKQIEMHLKKEMCNLEILDVVKWSASSLNGSIPKTENSIRGDLSALVGHVSRCCRYLKWRARCCL